MKNRVTSTTVGSHTSHVQYKALAAGAIPTTFVRGLDVLTIVKGTNIITITLRQGFIALLDENCRVRQAAYSAAGACEAKVISETVGGSAHQIVVGFFNAAGAAVDMAINDVFAARFEFKTTPGLA